MSLSYSEKRDANEKPIVAALRAVGVEVWHVSGAGLPDLLTLYRGVWLPLEVKNPTGKNRATRAQKEPKNAGKWPTLRSVEEAVALFGGAK